MEPQSVLKMEWNKAWTGVWRIFGDGDSKSYHAVVNANPPIYRDTEIKKLQCCGHFFFTKWKNWKENTWRKGLPSFVELAVLED